MPEQLYGKYEQIKEEQPEAVVLFKHGNNYYASMYDAETIANELNLPPSKERVPYDANKSYWYSSMTMRKQGSKFMRYGHT